MGRAIVIGGSLAGMCTARVLADVFDEVTIVDRDTFPVTVGPRRGVPQARHAHGLLERGRREFDALFPGFSSEIVAAGALSFDGGLHIPTRRGLGWQGHGPNGMLQLWSSRDLLEFTVRRLFRAQARVQLRERTRVMGLRVQAGLQPLVTGVVVRTDDAAQEELSADLVVDASGRGTRVETWLRECGVAGPTSDVVDAHGAYASRLYQAPRPRPAAIWWKGLWIDAQPPSLPRAGAIIPVEGDRWLVTLSGIADAAPPTDEIGFMSFMQRLGSPALAHAVSLATPLSDIAGNRQLQNVRRRYERWEGGLRGFIAVGDAACSFNPIYGQGMSVAAASAVLLRDMLSREVSQAAGFEARFYAQQAALVDAAWMLATRTDLVWPTTQGTRRKSTPMLGAYVALALKTGHFDPAVRRQILPIFNLTGSLKTLFRPSVVASVLRSSVRRRLRDYLFGRPPIPDFPPIPADTHSDEAVWVRAAARSSRVASRADDPGGV
jgi:2-polyprenyl-6-methoxyphenol hydroxylase-like FAD-dependent oxidoreductase